MLLKHSPGLQMPYLRLLKLLYIAEQESLREVMHPIVGGSGRNATGTASSDVYDLIEKQDEPWGNHIRLDEYDVELISDPGDSELCDYEVELLSPVIAETYQAFTEWQLVDLTHGFAEWIKAYPDPEARTSTPSISQTSWMLSGCSDRQSRRFSQKSATR